MAKGEIGCRNRRIGTTETQYALTTEAAHLIRKEGRRHQHISLADPFHEIGGIHLVRGPRVPIT